MNSLDWIDELIEEATDKQISFAWMGWIEDNIHYLSYQEQQYYLSYLHEMTELEAAPVSRKIKHNQENIYE